MWLIALVLPVMANPQTEVTLAELEGGVLSQPEVWVRLADGCVQGTIQDDMLKVPMCTSHKKLDCTASAGINTTWTGWSGFHCERPDGTGWGGGWGGSFHSVPQLIENSDEAARWKYVHSLEAAPYAQLRRSMSCVGGDTRICDESTGLVIRERTRRGARGQVAIAVIPTIGEVDCSIPCPPNPNIDRVRAMNELLADTLFVSDATLQAGVFSTQKACEQSTPTPLTIPDDVCKP